MANTSIAPKPKVRNQTMVTLLCACCGRAFRRRPCEATIAVTCSRKCMGQLNSVRVARRVEELKSTLSREVALSNFARGWLTGFFDAEGSIRIREATSITACNTDKDLIEFAATQLLQIGADFSVDEIPAYGKRQRAYILRLVGIESVVQFCLFAGFLCARKAKTLREAVHVKISDKTSAESLWDTSAEFRRGWITGFFEGDGCPSIRTVNGGRYGTVSFWTTDHDLITRIDGYLAGMGIRRSLMRREPRKANWSACYCIDIQNRADVHRFIQSLSLASARRRQQVQAILDLPPTQSFRRLTPDQVREMRHLYASGASIREIATRFSRHYQAVYSIIKGNRFKYLATS